MSIVRDELNKHLTNNVILRIDYVPIPDEKVDLINNILAKEFLVKNSDFSDVKQTFMRNIDIQMNDPSIQDFNEFIDLKERNRIKSYEYYKTDDNSNIEMKIIFNRQFCAIDVNQVIKYYNYEIYSGLFVRILNILKDYEIIINRFGLRKFNDFFVKKDTLINDYVKDKYFNLDCADLLEESNNFISEKRYTFNKDIYNINLITHSSIGKLENEVVKRIAFDIDLYITNLQSLKELLSDNNTKYIKEVNDMLFNIYINLLNEKMINILSNKSELNDSNIVFGVDYNENV